MLSVRNSIKALMRFSAVRCRAPALLPDARRREAPDVDGAVSRAGCFTVRVDCGERRVRELEGRAGSPALRPFMRRFSVGGEGTGSDFGEEEGESSGWSAVEREERRRLMPLFLWVPKYHML